jgi:hypothetical protein
MNLDPQDNLTALEQRLKQLRHPYRPRAELLQQLKSALGKAELALANVQPREASEGPPLQRKLIFTVEMARGSLKELERQP